MHSHGRFLQAQSHICTDISVYLINWQVNEIYALIYLVNIAEPLQYHIYAIAFPFDLRYESVTCKYKALHCKNYFLSHPLVFLTTQLCIVLFLSESCEHIWLFTYVNQHHVLNKKMFKDQNYLFPFRVTIICLTSCSYSVETRKWNLKVDL